MLVVHTGDSHLDTRYYGTINPATGVDREWESNARALASVVQVAVERDADCFIHAGDAWANGRPSAEAIMLFVDTLRPLTEAGIPIVLADGNHETIMVPPAQRTMTCVAAQALARITGRAEVHLVDRQPRLVTTSTGVQVMVMPWLSKATILAASGTTRLSPQESDQLVIDDALRHLDQMTAQADQSAPLLFAGHLTVDDVRLDNLATVSRRGSETDMAHLFAEPVMPRHRLEAYPYAYGALSHIHTAQKVGDRTYYAGSPNRLTLVDADKRKSANLIEITAGQARVTRFDTAARPMHVIDLASPTAGEKVDAIADGAIVALTLPPGETTLPDAVAAVVAERGARIVRTDRRPAVAPAPVRVEAISEQADPLTALHGRLAERFEQPVVERMMRVAAEVADTTGRGSVAA